MALVSFPPAAGYTLREQHLHQLAEARGALGLTLESPAEALRLLEHQEPRFRAAAALALGAAEPAGVGPEARAGLAALLRDTAEDEAHLPFRVAGIQAALPSVRTVPACAALSALAVLGDRGHGQEVAQLLSSGSADVVVAAAAALGELGGKFEDQLLPLLRDPRAEVRAASCSALGRLATAGGVEIDVVPPVAKCLSDSNPWVRVAALEALARMGDECAGYTNVLKDLVSDRASMVRAAAVKAFAAAGPKGQRYASLIGGCLYEPTPEVRAAAAETLAELGEEGAAFAEGVAALLLDSSPAPRAAALRALGKMGDAAKPLLHSIRAAAEEDSDPLVREAGAAAVRALTVAALAE